jgi:hypothetical protein
VRLSQQAVVQQRTDGAIQDVIAAHHPEGEGNPVPANVLLRGVGVVTKREVRSGG